MPGVKVSRLSTLKKLAAQKRHKVLEAEAEIRLRNVTLPKPEHAWKLEQRRVSMSSLIVRVWCDYGFNSRLYGEKLAEIDIERERPRVTQNIRESVTETKVAEVVNKRVIEQSPYHVHTYSLDGQVLRKPRAYKKRVSRNKTQDAGASTVRKCGDDPSYAKLPKIHVDGNKALTGISEFIAKFRLTKLY